MTLRHDFFIIILVFVKILALIAFLKGFFPIKVTVPGQSNPQDFQLEPTRLMPTEEQHDSASFEPPFDRMVFVLIDALRADFVLEYGTSGLPRMSFLADIVRRGGARAFMARAHPPTVTMPRIKALASGGIPGFVDVVLNFHSSSFEEDNLISQLHRQGKKLVFYGDETWMHLFPNHFMRVDGTSSFFVTDYSEVDTNVTRHLEPELAASDWDVLILHYLGLDHIGHLAGPHSPLVKPKLQEMDNIIRSLYSGLEKKDRAEGRRSLVVVCGDHGMSEQGSHGGSSASETATPLVLMNPHWTPHTEKDTAFKEIQQIDIAPTLSSLMGVPIPLNNLGVLVKEALPGLSMRHLLSLAYGNAQQLAKVLKENVADFERESGYLQYQRAVHSHTHWLEILNSTTPSSPHADLHSLGLRVASQYVEAMRGMRDKVAASLAQYDLHAMGTGTAVLWMVLLALTYGHFSPNYPLPGQWSSWTFLVLLMSFLGLLMTHCALCTSSSGSAFLCSFSLLSVALMVALMIFIGVWITACVVLLSREEKGPFSAILKGMQHKSFFTMFLVAGTFLHTISLPSSSFVEEEHQTWYFLTLTLYVLMCVALTMNWLAEFRTSRMKENSDNKNLAQDKMVYHQIRASEIHTNNDHSASKTPDQRKMTPSAISQVLAAAALLMLCRVARAWNRTGDKWAHLPDIGDWLVRPENIVPLSLVTLISLLLTSALMCRGTQSWLSKCAICIGACGVYWFRSANGALLLPGVYDGQSSKGTTEARIVYACIAVHLAITVSSYYQQRRSSRRFKKQKDNPEYSHFTHPCHQHLANQHRNLMADLSTNIHTAWTLLMFLLLRPHNVCLVAMQYVQQLNLSQIMRGLPVLTPGDKVLVYIWMGQAAYFYQGNSNSIASVDVSAGYVGLEDYNPALIGLLMALSTYAGPVFWWLSLLVELARSCQGHSFQRALQELCYTFSLVRALPVAVYVVLVTAQRYHLFVWSVFSPKLLYEGMHTLIVGVICCLVLAFRTCVID